jgi:hypothetical protein
MDLDAAGKSVRFQQLQNFLTLDQAAKVLQPCLHAWSDDGFGMTYVRPLLQNLHENARDLDDMHLKD